MTFRCQACEPRQTRPGQGLAVQAGFRDVASSTLAAPFRLSSVRHYLEFLRSSASPTQQILGQLDAAAALAAWAEMGERLGQFTSAEGRAGPNELLLTAGRR